jgi:hypothetical protein
MVAAAKLFDDSMHHDSKALPLSQNDYISQRAFTFKMTAPQELPPIRDHLHEGGPSKGTTFEGGFGFGFSSPEVFDCSAQDLVPALLSLLVCHTQHVAHKGRVALTVWQLIRVHIPDGADDSLQPTWYICAGLYD